MTALAPLPDPPMPLTVRRYITAGDLAELPPLVLTDEQQAALDRAVTTLGELALDTFKRRYSVPLTGPDLRITPPMRDHGEAFPLEPRTAIELRHGTGDDLATLEPDGPRFTRPGVAIGGTTPRLVWDR